MKALRKYFPLLWLYLQPLSWWCCGYREVFCPDCGKPFKRYRDQPLESICSECVADGNHVRVAVEDEENGLRDTEPE